MRRIAAASAAVAAAVALAACGGGGGSPALAAKSTPAPANPACPAVLSAIPARAPATAHQAVAVAKGLSVDQGVGAQVPKGSLLWSLVGPVAGDALKLSFDMSGLGSNAPGDLAAYEHAVTRVRHYCQTGN